VADHEERPVFDALLEQLVADLEPETALEAMLVERLAILFWRERRLAGAEAERVRRDFANANDRLLTISLQTPPLAEQYLVGRYQGMLLRQIKDTLRDLREERDRRLQTIEPIAGEDGADGATA
jgi:hypothetical protein